MLSCASLPAQSALERKGSPALKNAVDVLRRNAERSGKKEPSLLVTLVVDHLPEFSFWARQSGLPVFAVYEPAGVIVIEDRLRHFLDTTLLRADVRFADMGHLEGKEELSVPGHNLFVNNIQFVHSLRPLLDGSGSTVSIKENRFDSSDVDFKNRYRPNPRSASNLTTHAGIVASLIAGAGTSDPGGRGVARGSQMVSSSFVGLLPDEDADYEAFDIAVQNHSYGVGIENYYGAGALAYDRSVQEHPGLLHVFSAGNQGPDASSSGMYANLNGFANLTGNFKMAKNVFVIGAVDSFGQVTPFSSRGPAYDGRTKPDLLAFGHDGTSASAALVSGAAAVVRQACFEKYGFWPASDLVKAILVGTAKESGAPGPDFISGYGNLNLKKAVEATQEQLLAIATVAGGTSQTFFFELLPNIGRCNVTLSWNDVPATPNAARALVNDLDLSVVAPDGTVWNPWVLTAYPNIDSLSLPARLGRDSLNTLEQVSLFTPLPGTYQILVKGHAVVNDFQSFALCASWDTLGHFEWTCPIGKDPVPAGQEAVMRWETNYGAEMGVLAWKPVESSSWQSVDTQVTLGQGYRRWMAPDTFAAAQLRMLVAGKTFISDTFLIAPAPHLQIGFDCPDSVLLQWKAAGPEASYRLWGLGSLYLEPLLITTDTVVVLQKSEYPQQRFAVSVLHAMGTAEGPISSAPGIADQGAGCYISNLLAMLNEDNQVDLILELGSLFSVEQVFLEKFEHGVWALLAAETPPSFQMLFTDAAPSTGVNLYRARVLLYNGGLITGDVASVYFAGETGYFVMPNPVGSGRILTVLTRFMDETPRFRLFDALGRQVVDKTLDDTKVDIELPFLPPGYYFWSVLGPSEEEFGRGKLLVTRH